MFKAIAFMVLALSITASADEVFTINGNQGSKGDAVIALAKDPNTKVIRHTDMKLSDKGTLTKR